MADHPVLTELAVRTLTRAVAGGPFLDEAIEMERQMADYGHYGHTRSYVGSGSSATPTPQPLPCDHLWRSAGMHGGEEVFCRDCGYVLDNARHHGVSADTFTAHAFRPGGVTLPELVLWCERCAEVLVKPLKVV